MRQIFLIFSFLLLFVLPVNAQNYKFGKVSNEEVLQKEHPINKEANAAVLYRSQKVYYDLDKNEGFSLITEVHERIKIYNKEGFDWATKEIRKYNGRSDNEELRNLKGYTYNIVDGKLVEEKLRNDEIFEETKSKYYEVTKFTMPAVTEGSVIEYSYSISSPYLGAIGKTPLQYTIPINRLELDVKIPEYFVFSKFQNLRSPLNLQLDESRKNFTYSYTTTSRNLSLNTVRHSANNNKIEYLMNMYSLEKDNIPALKRESHVENLHNYAAFLDWELQYVKFPNSPVKNYSETWEGVTKSIYNDLGIGNELNRDNFYDDDLEAVLAGVSDPMMKTKKIFDLVKQKVKWNEYLGYFPDNGTKKAYLEGSGNTADINLLLVSMLNYANLKAYPILVSTPSNGIPMFPTRDGFNYVIAGLKINDDVILMDATDPTSGIGELPKRARNWQGRMIKEEGISSWVNLMPDHMSESTLRMNIQFDGTNLFGFNHKTYSGLSAKKFREEHSEPEKNNNIEKRLAGISEVEINEYKIENKADLGNDIVESFQFKMSSGAEVIGDKIYLTPLLFESIQENPFKEDDRTYPIFFDYPETKKYAINIMLPDDYEILSLPESAIVNLGTDDGQFKFIVNGSGNIIRLSSVITMNKSAFLPAEYEFLKKFYANIIKKHSEAIVLGKTIEDGFEESAEGGR